jgi:hypothetical protein
VFFNTTVSGPFFRFSRPIRNLQYKLSEIIKNLESKTPSNQKVLIFIGFFNVLEGLPKPDKNRRQNSDYQKKGQKHRETKETKNIRFLQRF